MNTHKDKTQEQKNGVAATGIAKEKSAEPTFKFEDNRAESVTQRKLQNAANSYIHQQAQPVPNKGNHTGLPDNLKSGIENLSGLPMDDVKVHYNSPQPAQLQAHAYAQGTDIHLAAGQEKHLPHEAWHVVQQKQGRVKPTLQLKGKIQVNDNAGLENEADVMGAKALTRANSIAQLTKNTEGLSTSTLLNETVQRVLKTKSSAHGDKVDGSMADVRQEVTNVIARNKNGEVLDDIGRLKTSIQSRMAEQADSDKEDPKYISHGVRITDEETQLTRLEDIREQQLASKDKKSAKVVDADGFTSV